MTMGYVVRGTWKGQAACCWNAEGHLAQGPEIAHRFAAVGDALAVRITASIRMPDAAIFRVLDDGREERLPSYEEALGEIEAAHDALDPVVTRRDAMAGPPLPLAVRCTTAATIALERFCADPLAALESAERRLLEDGEWREIGPDQWERDSKYAGLSRSNRATALRIEKRRVVDKAKAAKGGTP